MYKHYQIAIDKLNDIMATYSNLPEYRLSLKLDDLYNYLMNNFSMYSCYSDKFIFKAMQNKVYELELSDIHKVELAQTREIFKSKLLADSIYSMPPYYVEACFPVAISKYLTDKKVNTRVKGLTNAGIDFWRLRLGAVLVLDDYARFLANYDPDIAYYEKFFGKISHYEISQEEK